MKKLHFYFTIFITTLFLSSCGENTTKELVSGSPDKINLVKVSGKRVMSVDPFQTSIIINGFDQSDTLMTEIYARNLTAENVLFDWKETNQCILTFIQQDDTKRTMVITYSTEGNSLREVQ
jgi:predicted metalloprotease